MSYGEDKISFPPRLIKKDDLYGKAGYTLNLIKPNVYQFNSIGAGCHVYLIIGEDLNVLIDTGIITKFDSLNYLLTTEIGLKIEDIDLIINTHEHFDHVGGNKRLHEATGARILAHSASAEELSAHEAFIDGLKNPIWRSNAAEEPT